MNKTKYAELPLIKHAKKEFELLGWTSNGNFTDPMQESICNHILEILNIFSNYGHSGTTADYTFQLLNYLLKYNPLSPLTGDDSEWSEHDDILQNNRQHSVFKDKKTGECYDINNPVYWRWELDEKTNAPHKHFFTKGGGYAKRIQFPYTPPQTPDYVYDNSSPNQNENGLL